MDLGFVCGRCGQFCPLRTDMCSRCGSALLQAEGPSAASPSAGMAVAPTPGQTNGSVAGAAPPLLGWTAMTGEIHGHALLLVLIIYAWTPPHFWALAIHRKKEYANANIPMLPVTHGEAYTKLHVVLYTVLLLICSLLPYLTHMLSYLYLSGAVVLGAGYVYFVMRLWLGSEKKAGMDAFWYSIVYLMALFIFMLADHYLLKHTVLSLSYLS